MLHIDRQVQHTLLNIFLNAILIPKYGVQGAIAATVVSYLVCYAVRVVDARRFISFDINHVRFVSNLLVLFGMCGVVILRPEHMELLLTVGILTSFAMNSKALYRTAEKLLKR